MKKMNLALLVIWSLFSTPTSFADPNLEREIAISAEEINRSLPIRVDQYTTMLSVSTLENTISYRYLLQIYSKDVTKELVHLLKENLVTQCGAQSFKYFLGRGAVVQYNYITLDGQPITNVIMTKKTCLMKT